MALLRSQNHYCNLSIYEYKTLVGLAVLTDNMGVNTYYRYDWLGRLDQVYRIDDGVKQILQQYEYVYDHGDRLTSLTLNGPRCIDTATMC